MASKKIVWVDSRMRSELFRGVILKPNQDEAEAASLRASREGRLLCVARAYRGSIAGVVTLGGDGALVIDEQKSRQMVEGKAVEKPVDICGAGDSFSAGAAMTLAVTGDGIASARFGNLVASITIMKKGTGTASPEEVWAADERR